jgi:hypothetical protein
MSRKYYDVTKITLGENGKIELGGEELAALEQQQIEVMTAGGQFTPNPGETQFGINWYSCDGKTNGGQSCTNGWSCEGSKNIDDCRNVWDCDVGRNDQECSNSRSCNPI